MSRRTSHWASAGFTLNIYQPLPQGGAFLTELSISAQDWRHTISAFGGFDVAEFTLVDTLPVLEEWLEQGIGRGITAYDEAGEVMWDGFVDSVSLRVAGLEVTRGPLTEVANRVNVIYSAIDTSTNPPTPGERKQTGTLNDLESWARYGVWPVNVSVAGVTDTNANILRSTYLAERKHPATTSHFIGGSEPPMLRVRCLGWIHTLTYPYNQTASSGTINLSTKIQNILSAQLNSGWISTDYSRITTNTLGVPSYENNDQTALALIKGLVAMGDVNARRYLFGIYDRRQAVYEPASSTVDYEMRLGDPGQMILDPAGAEVYPWRVRPGRWIFFSDFLPGRAPTPDKFREDPRMLFIESVTFALPHGVQLQGGRAETFSQKLAQFGLAGASA